MKTLKSINASAIGLLVGFTMLLTPAVGQDNPKMSDAEVAHTAVVANQIDIDNSKIAMERSKNAEVLKFAKTMASDHKAVIEKATALVTKLGVTPKNNALSKKLLTDAEATKKMLRTKSGAAFNKAYIDNEVAYHKAVIETVENILIPDAENEELKSLLQSIVPALQAHLEHAQMIQEGLSGK